VRVSQGNYTLSGLVGMEITGKTVGVIGTGAIGAQACRLFRVRRNLHAPPYPLPSPASNSSAPGHLPALHGAQLKQQHRMLLAGAALPRAPACLLACLPSCLPACLPHRPTAAGLHQAGCKQIPTNEPNPFILQLESWMSLWRIATKSY
jgi:hypothetical protein